MRKRCLISFSGGETSAYMTWRLLKEKLYDEYLVVFANTGEEREETLEFVYECDRHFGFNTMWVERQLSSARFRVVSFGTAARKGEPFEAVISRYGIPNQAWKGCTRELKQYPIEWYAKSRGWKKKDYDLAIGIRVDEIDRMRPSSSGRNLIYPLIKPWCVSKPQINDWWAKQPFRLNLKSYQGNCKWCWKKSFRKLLTIAKETPEAFDFPERMEAFYGKVGPEFLRNPLPPASYKRTFFRGQRSVSDIRKAAQTNFIPAEDERERPHVSLFDETLDVGGGCEESCEVFSEET